MNVDYLDGRRERLRHLSDEQLTEQLREKASEADQIERLVIRREEPARATGEELVGNRHERRRQAALRRKGSS